MLSLPQMAKIQSQTCKSPFEPIYSYEKLVVQRRVFPSGVHAVQATQSNNAFNQTPIMHTYSYKHKHSVLHVATCSQQLEHALIRSKHDSSTWDHTEHVRYQSAVQRHHALFFPYQTEALCEASVLYVTILHGCLSESCTNNLRASQIETDIAAKRGTVSIPHVDK